MKKSICVLIFCFLYTAILKANSEIEDLKNQINLKGATPLIKTDIGDDKSYSFGINYLIEGKHEIAVGISTSDSNTDGEKLSSSGYYLSYYLHF